MPAAALGDGFLDADLIAESRLAIPEEGAGSDLTAAFDLAHRLAPVAAGLGSDGATAYLRALASVGWLDLTMARVVEPHLDALSILEQAGRSDLAPDGSTWGVYAASAPGLAPLAAAPAPDGGWRLDGTKPWCSLGAELTHALVTAQVPSGAGRLFAVRLADAQVGERPGAWVARGLTRIDSRPIGFDGAPATPVGEEGWYLQRPGFAWGGIGVAAVWFGAALALADALLAAAGRREPDQIALMHLGDADHRLAACAAVVRDAARRIDDGSASGAAGALLAARARALIASTAEHVLTVVGHALGPAPLTGDAAHARRVADLTVYLRQHHAERDLAVLGRSVLHVGPGE